MGAAAPITLVIGDGWFRSSSGQEQFCCNEGVLVEGGEGSRSVDVVIGVGLFRLSSER